MSISRKLVVLVAVLAVVSFGVWRIRAQAPSLEAQRTRYTKAYNDGNLKVAYDGLRKLALDPKNAPTLVGNDLELAITALMKLGRIDEIDEFREAVIKVHDKNWRLLATAARTYANDQHIGFIVAGKFQRGGHRGGGNQVNSMQRDRTRALQLMQQALAHTRNEEDKAALAEFHLQFAEFILSGTGYSDAWRLQYLTDLGKLPDYDEGPHWHRHQNHNGAPVDDKGSAILHKVPKSYEKAESDGERWRWMLLQAMELNPARTNEVDMLLADFMKSQLGVQTMAYYGWHFGDAGDHDPGDKNAGTFALHTLKDNETIARLATGFQRFNVPDEYNWIKIYQRVADRGRTNFGENALAGLAQEFEDRRQYPRGAEMWKRAIKEYGPGEAAWRQARLDQIVGNWGRFENTQTQPTGAIEPSLDFRFRNGKKVTFEAHEVNVPKILADVKAYLSSKPGHPLDQHQVSVNNIGYRLVELGQLKYLKKQKPTTWNVDLKPRPRHVDERVTVKTPLKNPGAYFVTAQMADGNLSRILVWVSDTILVKKQLEGQSLYFVADATTGEPIPGAKVEFFGWYHKQVKENVNQFEVVTKKFSETSDQNGQVFVSSKKMPSGYQWLITATKARAKGEPDRFAYLGYTAIWNDMRHDAEYNAIRTFVMTDRPAYRPEQTVQLKAWVRHAKYDESSSSSFAGQPFIVEIHDPQGEKVLDKTVKADEYGGIIVSLDLPKGAPLGVYGISVKKPGKRIEDVGNSSFRVEEYKKPEFEVTVTAPKEPVKLGDKITATIDAKYYFGAPVTGAVVKYKVLRQNHSATWYPASKWDWLYGSGYWWFAPNYDWYPGFNVWGCKAPMPHWWPQWGLEQPELVIEEEVPIGPDGKVQFVIDTTDAKELHGNQDHQYSISAEVTDQSRRTIVGDGTVLVARKPFAVHAWLDKGHYRVGDTMHASFRAHTLDQKPVQGKGELTLYAISYNDKNEPVEKAVETWKLDTTAQGEAAQQIKAAKAGQYRLSYKVTDAKKNTIEGGYVFLVRGEGFDGAGFRFNDIELTSDKKEFKPGDKVKLAINTNKADSTVLLFARPTDGVYLPPKVLRLKGKSTEEELTVVLRDMPNFYVEVMTIADGRVHVETREVIVPPEKRVLNVEVLPSQQEYKPGQKANVKFKVTDLEGKPFVGSTVVSIYDKAVEYISGGSNVPEIKKFFWDWRRQHAPHLETSRVEWSGNLLPINEIGMGNLGLFGGTVVEEMMKGGMMGAKIGAVEVQEEIQMLLGADKRFLPHGGFMGGMGGMGMAGMGMGGMPGIGGKHVMMNANIPLDAIQMQPGQGPTPMIRKNFADTALWSAALKTDKAGLAEVSLTMPEQLTAWKIRVWAMGHGTKVGQGEAEVVTKRDLIVRLQAPRFFVQKDEVVLSANVHNYLKAEKKVRVTLEFDGGTLSALDPMSRDIKITSGGEYRVDWRVKVVNEGEAVVRMKAVSDEDADAMEMRFPVFVHGMLKTESFTGVVRDPPGPPLGKGGDGGGAKITFNVPAERRVNDSVLEVRYSPTLAGAMVDSLPYLVDYPYGCTEQTLNRFLPTVITQRLLQNMKLDLKEIEKHRTNLNSGEIGDDKKRVKDWQRLTRRNPVFNEAEVRRMSQAGVLALQNMQLSDGGWGWFSGYGEHSWPHTTATVVHGLQIAKEMDVPLPNNMLESGVQWLQRYQDRQVFLLKNAATKSSPWKPYADNIDALVYMTLVDGGTDNVEMRDFLYRDRTEIAVYAKAMYGLALHKQKQKEKLDMIMKNIEQYLVSDDENQTAYLRMPESNQWWYWHGNEVEANAYYLKLLARTNPRDERASRMVKYLLNNRRHATYWNSTRDTAICVEAFADYLRATGEDNPDMTVEVWLDGKKHKEVKIDKSNLFSFDNKLVLTGDKVTTGKHTLEIKRNGSGPVYFNAYLTYFTLEDHITKAGLEVKVNRKYYKLTRVEEKIKVSGSRGQALDQAVEKYTRAEVPNLGMVKSGDLIEVELEIDSKNDYEYLIFEDPKASGFEPMALQSGYVPNTMGAYMELRDEKVAFFVRHLARGKHSIAYRLRAEIPGTFSALPTRAYAMYAPELKGNSDEIKIRVQDK